MGVYSNKKTSLRKKSFKFPEFRLIFVYKSLFTYILFKCRIVVFADQDNVKYCNFNEILEKYSCIPNDIYRTEI